MRRVTRDPAQHMLPSWSSDGRFIYFCSDRQGELNVWKIPFEGGDPVQVTRHGGWESHESSDGKYLYYSQPAVLKTIHRLDLATGDDIQFPQLGDAGARRYWTVTARGMYFVNTVSDPHWIQFFDFGSRQISKIRQITQIIRYGPGGLSVSPDNRTLLWSQKDQDDQDIMLVKGFE